jgi:polyphosphate kinase
MPAAMISLKLKLQISSYDAIMPGGRHHNFRFHRLPQCGPGLSGKPCCRRSIAATLTALVNAFDAIAKQDILLYYPYHKFHHFTELVRQAF